MIYRLCHQNKLRLQDVVYKIEERIYESGDTAILQWKDPAGFKGGGFFQFKDGQIIHQKGYFDQLSFFKANGVPIPNDSLDI